MRFKLGELFSGPGGLGYAASISHIEANGELFSIEHAWANDYHEDSCETYRQNVSKGKPESVICEDIRNLDFNRLSPIDAFMYGFPCNDFSIVGESKGFEGEFGPLYTYGVKILKQFQPKWFIAENVGGLTSANEGKAFKKILTDLSGAGYVLTVHLYKFEEYGIPQSRHRIIIVGINESENKIFHVPKPSRIIKTCKEAIENPPIPDNAFNNELTQQSHKVIERLKYIKPGQNAWNAELPEHLKLNVRGAKLSQIYKRLDPEQPSYTVTGSGGGGTHVYHWKENRALTNRERARLQTFPDNFKFYGSKESVRKQIGMAVPVEGAKIIITSILKTFANIEYDYIEPSFGYVESSKFNNSPIFFSLADTLQDDLPITAVR
ncbi:MAG: DNA cytosine methyltransferase [Candidatus Auribacterota bacterium]